MNNLSILTNQSTIKSTELVDIINQFREMEGGKAKLQHYDFYKKIEKELKILKELGLGNDGNISVAEYLDKKGELRPCFELSRDGMLQILNSESTYVRYKTIEYINKLEEKLKIPTTYKEALLQLVQAEEEREQLQLENSQKTKVIEEQKPKVLFSEAVENSTDLILVKEMATIITQSGFKIGQNELFEYLRKYNYLCSKKGGMYHLPTKKYEHLFKVTKRNIQHTNSIEVANTPKVNGKGQIYFVKKFAEYKLKILSIKDLLAEQREAM